MNILEQSEALKDLPEQVLMREMQMPSGNFPQYLVLTEIKRRKRVRDEYQRREAQDMPTVAEEAVQAAGMPQEGVMQLAKNMAPQTNMGQNTSAAEAMPQQPTMGMAKGGIINMREGGRILRTAGAEFALFEDGEVYRIAPNGRRFKAPEGLAKGVREFAMQVDAGLATENSPERPLPKLGSEVLSETAAFDPTTFSSPTELPSEFIANQATIGDFPDSIVTRAGTDAPKVLRGLPFQTTIETFPDIESPDIRKVMSDDTYRLPAFNAGRSDNIIADAAIAQQVLDKPALDKALSTLDSRIVDDDFQSMLDARTSLEKKLQKEREDYKTDLLERDYANRPEYYNAMPNLSGDVLLAPKSIKDAAKIQETDLAGSTTFQDAIDAFNEKRYDMPYNQQVAEQALLLAGMGDAGGFFSGANIPRTDRPFRTFLTDDKGVPIEEDEFGNYVYAFDDTALAQTIEEGGLSVPDDVMGQLFPKSTGDILGPLLDKAQTAANAKTALTQEETIDQANFERPIQETKQAPIESGDLAAIAARQGAFPQDQTQTYSDPYLNPSIQTSENLTPENLTPENLTSKILTPEEQQAFSVSNLMSAGLSGPFVSPTTAKNLIEKGTDAIDALSAQKRIEKLNEEIAREDDPFILEALEKEKKTLERALRTGENIATTLDSLNKNLGGVFNPDVAFNKLTALDNRAAGSIAASLGQTEFAANQFRLADQKRKDAANIIKEAEEKAAQRKEDIEKNRVARDSVPALPKKITESSPLTTEVPSGDLAAVESTLKEITEPKKVKEEAKEETLINKVINYITPKDNDATTETEKEGKGEGGGGKRETDTALEAANIATQNILANTTNDTGIRAAGSSGTSAGSVAKEALAQKGLNTDQWLAIAAIGAGVSTGNPKDVGPAVRAGLSYLQKSKQGNMAYQAKMKEIESREKIARINAAATAATKKETRDFREGKFLFEQGQKLYETARVLDKSGETMDRALKMMNEGRIKMGLPALDDSVLVATARKETLTVPNTKTT